MEVKYGERLSEHGPGVCVELTGDDVALAIYAYLIAHGIHVNGPRTVTVNGELCKEGLVFVDPSGSVTVGQNHFSGRGAEKS